MHTLIQDLRFAFRMLLKNPGVTTVAALVLALAIGGTTAMFTIVNNLVFRPLAVKSPDELVRLYAKDKQPGGSYRGFSYPNYVEIRERNGVFRDVLAFTMAMVGVTEGDTTHRSFAALVSANYFTTFGVRVAAGRDFLPEEERPGSAIPVVIVSHAYWRKAGADPSIVGKTLRINSRMFNVIGVAPEYFGGTTALFSPEFWLPLGMYEAISNDFTNEKRLRLDDRNHHCLILVGRLEAGVTEAAAQAQLQSLASQLEAAYPTENKDYTFEVGRLSRMSINTSPQKDRGLAKLSVLLMAMSSVVLLIACLNLANMLLARGAARRKEIAIRLSLGGSRTYIVRQLLIESLLLSLLGGVGGLVLSYWSTKLLIASLAPKIPFMVIVFDAHPDLRVLAATLGFCLLSTLFFGLGPAWKLAHADLTSNLKEQVSDDLHARVSRSIFAPRSLLVVGQIALSLALLTAAGLFMRSAIKAANADPGFSLNNSILVEADASLAGYDEPRGREVYLNLVERLRTTPGVEAASFAYVSPFGLFSDGRNVQIPGVSAGPSRDKDASIKPVGAGFNIVSTDYFKTLGLPLLRGRDFNRHEVESTSAACVAIIDEPLAKRLWPGENPVGRQIQFAGRKSPHNAKVMEVVGVVAGVRDDLNEKLPRPHVYVPFGQEYRSGVNFHVKITPLDGKGEASMLKTVRDTIRSVDPRLAVISIQTLSSFHDGNLLLWFVRTGARLFAIFSALALFLAVVGVYGIKAYFVTRRTREIGIRMALGATTRDVLWMVLRDGLRLTAAGLGIGLFLAVAVGLLLRSLLYDARAIDPLTFAVAALCLGTAALVACYFPARREHRPNDRTKVRITCNASP
jgi:predicted permease